jgi:Ca-activated chloride channel family protein
MNHVHKQLTRSTLAIVISAIIVSGCAQESTDSAKRSQPQSISKTQSASETHSTSQHNSELHEVAGLVVASKSQADLYTPVKQQSNSVKVNAASMVQRTVSGKFISRNSVRNKHLRVSDRNLSSAPTANDKFESVAQNGNMLVAETPVSTFSIDVDTGSYSTTRRLINQGQLPSKNTVRVEELVNYFSNNYPTPTSTERPFSVNTELAPSPYNADTQLLRIGIKGFDVATDQLGATNLVLTWFN